jgi:fatty-acyl-CoA synthase
VTATLSSLLDAYLDAAQDAPCLRCPDERGEMQQLLRRDLAAHLTEYAAGLWDLGVRRGDRVILAIDTSVEFVALFWAVLRLGAVAVPSAAAAKHYKTPQRVALLERIGALTQPRVVVAAASTAQVAKTIGAAPVLSAAALRRSGTREVPRPTIDERDCAVLQFTSGSTAAPKGCVLAHSAIIANARSIVARVEARPSDTAVSWLPLFHDMGLMTGLVAPMVGGLSMSLRPPSWFLVNPMSWLTDLGRFERSHTAVPNFALALLTERIKLRQPPDLRLSSVATFVCGAEPVDPQLVRAFLDVVAPFGFSPRAFHAGYGMAEATLMVTSRPFGLSTHVIATHALRQSRLAKDADASEPGTEVVNLGRPVDGAALRIVDTAANVLADGRLGEIEVSSPSLMKGYFENDAETRKVLRDGWLRTGDIGYLRDGELFVTGRASDLIIVAGSNIAPVDLEIAVARDAAIDRLRLAAFGCRGRMGTDDIHFVVELRSREGWDSMAAAIAQACFDACGVIPAATVPVPMGTIPRTTSGKVRRGELRDAIANGALPLLSEDAQRLSAS